MKLPHPALQTLLQKAYSGERAAALAYVGHAASLRDPVARAAVKQIEDDEWNHRRNLKEILDRYEIPVSRSFELRFYCIGRIISASCHVIGWFMPYFFAGKLESGNVCEYFVMLRHFHTLGIHDHDQVLYEMGIKEKEHEVYFLEQIRHNRLLPWFERVFHWGPGSTVNDVDLDHKYPIAEAHTYCRNFKRRRETGSPDAPLR
jgi:hypothetical protein